MHTERRHLGRLMVHGRVKSEHQSRDEKDEQKDAEEEDKNEVAKSRGSIAFAFYSHA